MPKSLLIISYNSNESFEYFPFFFSHRIFNKSKTARVASGTGTAYLFGAPEFTLGFFWFLSPNRQLCIVSQTVVCRFVSLLCLVIVFSALRCTASGYSFDFFKLLFPLKSISLELIDLFFESEQAQALSEKIRPLEQIT